MSCLSASRKQRLIDSINKYEEIKTAIEAALLSGSLEIESYTFDSGEARQVTKYKSFEEMQKAVEWCDSRIEWAYGKLNGTSLINLNLRRKKYTGFGYPPNRRC